ncbi:MAG: ATP-grasp domain-containing protein, partial [bacterium]|nr:ATP-grasp domain-containing protein [bacterium]
KTFLLSSDLVSVREQVKKCDQFPIVLKRIQGYMGKFVDKADDADGVVEVVKKFWERGDDRFPIIAQEFVLSDSYRVLTIGGEVVQTALKKNKDWKATGTTSKTFEKFALDVDLKKIIKKVNKAIDIDICGIDFAKREDGSWILIEVNSGPAYDFFDDEFKMLIEKALRHLKKKAIRQKISKLVKLF